VSRRRPVAFGIDGGATVGIATYVRGKFLAHQLPVEDALPWMRGWLQGQLDRGEHTIVGGLEAFTRGSVTGHHVSRQDDASDFNASFARLCQELTPEREERWNIVTYLQGAGEAKTVVTDATLRQLGWYQAGKRHANDGARHLGLRLLGAYPVEYEHALSGAFHDVNTVREV
jgi:hypothetical protein